MKNIISIILLSFLPLLTYGSEDRNGLDPNRKVKISKVNVVDTSFMECVYFHEMKDPYFVNPVELYEILEIGLNYTQFHRYDIYQRDSSLVEVKEPITEGVWDSISRKYRYPVYYTSDVIRDFKKNELTFVTHMLMDYYRCREPIPEFEWTIHADEVKPLCGHLCTKATASFRGRDWTAWFTEEIPVDNGPWKFNGLPGLILMVTDAENQHLFEAIQIRKSHRPIEVKEHRFYFDAKRKNLNKELLGFFSDPTPTLEASNMVQTPLKDKKKRMFYVPFERD